MGRGLGKQLQALAAWGLLHFSKEGQTMAAQLKRWGTVALAMAGTLAATGTARAQFNPYVMPRFNPLTTTTPSVTTTASIPSYGSPYDPYSSSYYNPYSYGYGPLGGAYMGMAEIYR